MSVMDLPDRVLEMAQDDRSPRRHPADRAGDLGLRLATWLADVSAEAGIAISLENTPVTQLRATSRSGCRIEELVPSETAT